MSKSTWATIAKGDRVELRGLVFTVDKIKAKGKRAKVVVVGQGGRFESEVKLKDAVTLAPAKTARGKAREVKLDKRPLHDAEGRQQRWATAKEIEPPRLPAGDHTMVTKPSQAKGGAWSEPKGKVERVLAEHLGAHLVGESLDEGGGYFVPPVDGTTVAAHWMLFHEGDDWQDVGEAELLRRHDAEHEAALNGGVTFTPTLKVNHWHTKERPTR